MLCDLLTKKIDGHDFEETTYSRDLANLRLRLSVPVSIFDTETETLEIGIKF